MIEPSSRPDRVLGVLRVPGAPESIGEMRGFTRHKLGVDHARVDDVTVCVSELGTNGYEHTASGKPGGYLTLVLSDHDGMIRVELIDDGGARSTPRIRCGDPNAEHGRGLFLVRALASRWGVDGTTTWCEFDPT